MISSSSSGSSGSSSSGSRSRSISGSTGGGVTGGFFTTERERDGGEKKTTIQGREGGREGGRKRGGLQVLGLLCTMRHREGELIQCLNEENSRSLVTRTALVPFLQAGSMLPGGTPMGADGFREGVGVERLSTGVIRRGDDASTSPCRIFLLFASLLRKLRVGIVAPLDCFTREPRDRHVVTTRKNKTTLSFNTTVKNNECAATLSPPLPPLSIERLGSTINLQQLLHRPRWPKLDINPLANVRCITASTPTSAHATTHNYTHIVIGFVAHQLKFSSL